MFTEVYNSYILQWSHDPMHATHKYSHYKFFLATIKTTLKYIPSIVSKQPRTAGVRIAQQQRKGESYSRGHGRFSDGEAQ